MTHEPHSTETPVESSPRFQLSEDWQATLISIVLVALIAIGLLQVRAWLPWPLFGLFS